MPSVLWGGLAGFLAFAAATLLHLIRAQRRKQSTFDDSPVFVGREALEADTAELVTIAVSARESAERARIAAETAVAEHAAAEAEREAAWQAHTDAVQRLTATTTATGSFPVITPGGADQAEVTRAARSAYRRGEITVDELQAVWHRVGGLDPEWARRAHQLAVVRAAGAAAWRRYELASLAERSARQAADIALVAARALAEEAAQAAAEAGQ
jgi:hypothetical protein